MYESESGTGWSSSEERERGEDEAVPRWERGFEMHFMAGVSTMEQIKHAWVGIDIWEILTDKNLALLCT